MQNNTQSTEKVYKMAVNFINELSPHNVWHPHDFTLPVTERRLSERAENALNNIIHEAEAKLLEKVRNIVPPFAQAVTGNTINYELDRLQALAEEKK